MRKTQLIILFLLCAQVLFAQNAGKADALFQEGNYQDAKREYGLLLKHNPSSPLYLYRYARCAQELGEYQTAIEYFKKSGNRYDLKHFNLGEVYIRTGEIEKAVASYNKYLQTLRGPNEREEYVRAQLRKADNIQRYLRRVEKVQIIDSVEVPLDSLLTVYELSSETGSLDKDSTGQVVYTNQRKDLKMWAVQQDSTEILVCNRNLMDTWTTPDTLPREVNISTHQNYPYLLNDGVTLYFASKDTNGLGGYDIYVTRYNTYTQSYTNPENIGYPYNSDANDYLLVLDEAHQIGYFATDRHSRPGYVHIYTFLCTEQKSYWRDLPADSLWAYAQLHSMLRAERPTVFAHSTPDAEQQDINQEDKIFFVLNDSVVYTSIQDFTHPTASQKYQEWYDLQLQLEQDQCQLSALRKQYGEADEDVRKQLTPLILNLENKRSQLLVQSESLLRTIRRIESQGHHF